MAGAAAVFAFVVIDDDDRESVEVVPAESTTTAGGDATSTTVAEATTTTAPEDESLAGAMPERPLVVATADSQGILVVDADTGEVVRGLARLTDEQFVTDLELPPDGTVYFAENPADSPPPEVFETAVRAVTPAGEIVDVSVDLESLSPALSDDGSFLAYAVRRPGDRRCAPPRRPHRGRRRPRTGETRRRYAWDEDDPDFFHTNGHITSIDFTPDNESLLLTVAYEGTELLRLDLEADGLTDGVTTVANVDARFATWAPDGRVLARSECCFPEYERDSEVVAIDPASGDVTTVDRSGAVAGLSAESSGDWVQDAEGTIRRLGTDIELHPDLGDPGLFGPFYMFDAG